MCADLKTEVKSDIICTKILTTDRVIIRLLVRILCKYYFHRLCIPTNRRKALRVSYFANLRNFTGRDDKLYLQVKLQKLILFAILMQCLEITIISFLSIGAYVISLETVQKFVLEP